MYTGRGGGRKMTQEEWEKGGNKQARDATAAKEGRQPSPNRPIVVPEFKRVENGSGAAYFSNTLSNEDKAPHVARALAQLEAQRKVLTDTDAEQKECQEFLTWANDCKQVRHVKDAVPLDWLPAGWVTHDPI
jgi:hypothetical protein